MASDERPGGLTVLAVLNFIFGGQTILKVARLVFVLVLTQSSGGSPDGAGEAGRKIFEAGLGSLIVVISLTLASAALLIISGIGYLKQKRVLGRVMGNVYGVVALGGLIWTLAVLETFSVGNLADLVLPVFNVVLINTTFRQDLVR